MKIFLRCACFIYLSVKIKLMIASVHFAPSQFFFHFIFSADWIMESNLSEVKLMKSNLSERSICKLCLYNYFHESAFPIYTKLLSLNQRWASTCRCLIQFTRLLVYIIHTCALKCFLTFVSIGPRRVIKSRFRAYIINRLVLMTT